MRHAAEHSKAAGGGGRPRDPTTRPGPAQPPQYNRHSLRRLVAAAAAPPNPLVPAAVRASGTGPSKSEEAPSEAAKAKQRPLPLATTPPRAPASHPPHGCRTPLPGLQCPCAAGRHRLAAPHTPSPMPAAPLSWTLAPHVVRFLGRPTHEHHEQPPPSE